MRQVLWSCLFLAVVGGSAYATPQHEKMKTCNQQASGMKGPERKAFMKKCLSGGGEQVAKNSSRQRMKDCNQKAKGMKGKDRRSFMSTCLKG